MRSSKIFTRTRIIWMCLPVLFLAVGELQAQHNLNRRAKSIEKTADNYFIRKDFDRAMLKYEKANDKLNQSEQQRVLRLKMARLYMVLQKHAPAVGHYEWVMKYADSMLSVDDVCNVMDAYRRMDMGQQAELVSRRYAFRNPYYRSQRYTNAVQALSNQRHYYARGFSEYLVEPLPINSAQDEYWISSYKGEMIYAGTKSDMHDLRKINYHRSQYYKLSSGKLYPFDFIPLPLQNGPMAFNEAGSQIIVTKTSYARNDKINEPGEGEGVFLSELFVSSYDKSRRGWSEFVPLFAQIEGQPVNYAHPFYINGGNVLLFSSDRPGGFGGMDIYISYWDDTLKKWIDPINMGDQINTEGDEIHPSLNGDILSFSSNGHEGFGGYDVYDINYVNNKVLRGSLSHLSYPINSVYNDFGLYRIDDMQGYFISDRANKSTYDDIYSFTSINTPLSLTSIRGVYDEDAALKGVLNVIKDMNREMVEIKKENVSIADVGFRGPLPETGSVILTIYFDFNSDKFADSYKQRLDDLIGSDWFSDVDEFEILGYADELGSDFYNKRLSEKRAKSVTDYIKANSSHTPKMQTQGKGRLLLSAQEQLTELIKANDGSMPIIDSDLELRNNSNKDFHLTFEQRKLANRPARKVDIVVRVK